MTQSVTGFGFALVMAPALAIAWEVKPGIATTVLLGGLVNIMLLMEVRGHVAVPRVAGLFVGFLIGVVPGILLLDRLDTDLLQIVVAATILVTTVLLYFQPEIDPGHDSLLTRMVAGAVGGASGSSTSIGGPPVVLYLLGRERDVATFRATLLAYFLPTSLITCVAFVVAGQVSDDVVVMSAAGAPAVVIGALVGAWLRRQLNQQLFRRLVFALLIVASVVIIALTALQV